MECVASARQWTLMPAIGPLRAFVFLRPTCVGARRGRRDPAGAHGGAVWRWTRRLPCGARGRGASHNSLRALRALRSDKCDENVHEARCARRPCRCAPRRPTNRPRRVPPAATLGLWCALPRKGQPSWGQVLFCDIAKQDLTPVTRSRSCAGLRLPRRWASGFRDVGARVSSQRAPTQSAGVTGGCTGQLEAVAHAAESRAPATVVAPAPWCATTASARGCKQHGADARRAGPGHGTARRQRNFE